MAVSVYEIKCAEEACKARGGQRAMLSLTVPHDSGESLSEVFLRLSKIKKQMFLLRSWRKLSNCLDGAITVLHILHGKNGWHPHIHMLLFFKPESPVPEESEVSNIWLTAMLKQGLDVSFDHSASFKLFESDNTVGYYLCGLNDKKNKGRNIFEIIASAILKNNYSDLNLLQEYALAVKGRHNVSWSKGLRRLSGLQEKKGNTEMKRDLIASLSAADWKAIDYAGCKVYLPSVYTQYGDEAFQAELYNIQDAYINKVAFYKKYIIDSIATTSSSVEKKTELIPMDSKFNKQEREKQLHRERQKRYREKQKLKKNSMIAKDKLGDVTGTKVGCGLSPRMISALEKGLNGSRLARQGMKICEDGGITNSHGDKLFSPAFVTAIKAILVGNRARM
ncbi:hypothetical protein FY034_15165 [Trichlorobacter lovleyi]|uniref:hypothetical protein n=1 Tax=Trichlorobacter lovleyi TaxID=313985 RepID=UPI00223FD025|nr:hypothetical protein [Trichlorobacter lovleyi]QOX80217.1 hypothetical protein FY034_15165 [Trichlorobacter lovleyi]